MTWQSCGTSESPLTCAATAWVSALFERVEAWAQLHGCRQLKIETQNTNVHACRFYERHGCQLRVIHRAAYPELPEEIQLLWYKDLVR